MPRALPTFALRDVASHNNERSCYVSIGQKVYDIMPFLDAHPGGGDLIVEYGGKDVSQIMGDEISHLHSVSAYEMLEEHHIGYMATESAITGFRKLSPIEGPMIETDAKYADGILDIVPKESDIGSMAVPKESEVKRFRNLSSLEGPMIETDAHADYVKHKFLDLNKPLLEQVWNAGFSKDFYLEQVHRPRYKLDSVQVFGNFLESLTGVPWYIVPICWVPHVAIGSYLAYSGLPSLFQTTSYWLLGLSSWTLVEYGLHRVLFHMDRLYVST